MIETSPVAARAADGIERAVAEPRWSAKRRDFLRLMGAGAATLGPLVAACGSSGAQTAAEALREQLVRDEAFWTGVQDMFILKP